MNYICVPGIKDDYRAEIAPVVTPERIIEAVCEHFKLSLKGLQGRSRVREFVYARHIIFYLLRKHTKMSLKSAGELFGRDHTTVIHSVDTLNNLMYTEPDVRAEVELIEEKVKEKI
jgi:chromosomal replication initiator protein